MSQKETSCQRKKLPVTGKNFLSQEETFSKGKKLPPVTTRNLLSNEETSCHMKKHFKIDTQMDEHNEEEEIAENVPLLQNAYKILKNAINPYWIENSENGDWHFVIIFNKSSIVIDKLLKEKSKFGFVDK